MKILILTNLFPTPLDPGRATFNYQQFLGLSEYHEIEVIVPISWIDFIRAKRQKEFNPGIKYKVIPFFNIPGFVRVLNPFFLVVSLLVFLFPYKSIIKSDFMILSWAYPDAVAGSILATLFKKKTICKVHGNDINVFSTHKFKGPLIRWALARSAAVISVSNDLAGKVKSLGITRTIVRTIYNGVDHEIFTNDKQLKPRETGSTKTILFVGNLKESKGCLDLLEAYNNLESTDEIHKLVFIGDGPCFSKLNTHANKSSEIKKICLLGRLPHNEIVSWFKDADMLCLPSYNEGVPNVVLEAMSCGLPVIATRVGGIPEVLPESCGKLVAPGDVNELRLALQQFDRDEYSPDAIIEESLKYDWKVNINDINELIAEVI